MFIYFWGVYFINTHSILFALLIKFEENNTIFFNKQNSVLSDASNSLLLLKKQGSEAIGRARPSHWPPCPPRQLPSRVVCTSH